MLHELKQVEVPVEDERGEVSVCVGWSGRIWEPPDAKSKCYTFDVYQT